MIRVALPLGLLIAGTNPAIVGDLAVKLDMAELSCGCRDPWTW